MSPFNNPRRIGNYGGQEEAAQVRSCRVLSFKRRRECCCRFSGPWRTIRIRTSKQGIDFIHDGTNRVRIRLGYQRYQRSIDSLAGWPSTILSRAIQRKRLLHDDADPDESSSNEDGDDEDEGERAIVVVGRQFEGHQRVMYAVHTIEGTKVRANVLVWPLHQNGMVEFEIDNVATWIQSRFDEDDE